MFVQHRMLSQASPPLASMFQNHFLVALVAVELQPTWQGGNTILDMSMSYVRSYGAVIC